MSLTACSAASTAEPPPSSSSNPASESSAGSESPVAATETANRDNETPETVVEEPETQESIQAKWQESAHASSYVLDEAGKNDACARCHAPVNWIPSMEDMPESCYACKFEIDPPPPLINEAEWTHIECKVCHQVKKDRVEPEIKWLEIAQIEEYTAVESAQVLCLKCHAPADLPGHVNIAVGGAHVEMACSDCHEAHTLAASCAESGCHETMESASTSTPGHDADHAGVSCSACHDAAGLEVGPDETGTWVTFAPQAESTAATPRTFTSHDTALEAPCQRCHFADNPWGLSLVEEGAP